MRILITLSLLLLSIGINIHAKDVIVLRNGGIINGIVTEVSTTEVKFKKASNPNGPIYIMDKNEVLSVKYENGEIDKFEINKENISNDYSLGLKEAIPADNNQQIISLYNIEIPQRDNKHSNTITNYAYVYWGISEKSILSDNNLEISIQRLHSKEYNAVPQAAESLDLYPYCISVKNKSNKPIYIDLGTSYRVNRTEDTSNSIPWYDGTVFTETQHSSSGIGLGLGAITNSLGIGGAVGTLANGISVGGAKGNGVSSNRGIQRFMSIAPNASMKLPAHPYVDGKNIKEHYEWLNMSSLENGKKRFNIKKWELRHYNIDESPFGIDFYITYSTNPDFSEYTILPIQLYSRQIYGRSGMETITPNKYGIQNIDKFLFGDLYLK